MDYIIALDQGTSSTRALAFDLQGTLLATEQTEFMQIYPQSGWVEHDATEIWQTVLRVLSRLQSKMEKMGGKPLCMGITNQRETTVVWDSETGNPYGHAIVWQDRRTAESCEAMIEEGYSNFIHRTTGLFLDPYFSASKLAWILDHRMLRSKKGLKAGTIESYLTFMLSGGQVHITDATNASRTSLMGLTDQSWNKDLLGLFDIPSDILPTIVDNAGQFAMIADGLPFAGVQITGLIGDQQSAAVGQACLKKGSIKATYGTGCFLLAPMGEDIVYSKNKLLTTVATQIKGKRSYAMEGAIFNAGTVIQWLRDGLGLMKDAAESDAMARSVKSNEGLYFVSAFTGLGAPHWKSDARGMMIGLERFHTKAHMVRAGLESVIFQTCDLIGALEKDTGERIATLKVDGGMADNHWFTENLATYTGAKIMLPQHIETTAFGAAFMAGLGAGVYEDIRDIKTLWKEKRSYDPSDDPMVSQTLKDWQRAVKLCLSH